MSAFTRLSLTGVIFYSLVALGCSTDRAGGRDGGDGNGTGGGGNPGGKGSAGVTGIIVDPGVLLATCGNSKLDDGEFCDDGNKTNGDGCNEVCQLEADYLCPTVGAPCVFSAVCGDGKLATLEACDDGNTVGGDGCSADCTMVETGFQCRVPGRHCVPLCGDSLMTGTENCDDGNSVSGDGCSSTCLTEPGWSCAGAVCTQSVCGNSVQEAGETCDAGSDNGLFFGDATGCSKTCTREPTCRDAAGATTACITPCGDGNIDPGEGCDDGNQVSGDGCSATCEAEAGFTCMPMERPDTAPCTTAAGQQCLALPITYRDFDAQNLPSGHPDFFFLGGTTKCVPNASGLPATRTNGNDPNTACYSSDATALCQNLVSPTLGADAKPALNAARPGGATCACRFTDWDGTGLLTGAAGVQTCYDAGGNARPWVEQSVTVIQSATSLAQWFTDSALSTKVVQTLELAQLAGTNQYQFSSSAGRTVYDDLHDIFMGTGTVANLSSGFFPLETQTRPKVCNIWPYWNPALATNCLAADGAPVGAQWDPRGSYTPMMAGMGGPVKPVTGNLRNFYFTSEVRYLFRYVGGETLAFFGDDDVWVFINGRLVLDLGAPHERLQGTVALTAAGATWTINSQSLAGVTTPISTGMVPNLGLEVGKTYEIAVFHADRHPRESNYQLTLSGFSTQRSTCQPTCGDGVTTAAEECDEGPGNVDGVYGGCTTQCKFGPFCGDGVVDAAGEEECDAGRMNGINAGYGMAGCTAGCKLPPRCGDGVTDTTFGEQCDAGDQNSATGVCTAACTFVPR